MFQQQNLNLLETQNCVFLVLRVQRFSFPKYLTQSSVVLKNISLCSFMLFMLNQLYVILTLCGTAVRLLRRQ